MEVIQILKPKAIALGFSKEELEVVANQIRATLPENATDEQIDAAVEAAIPYLKVSQTAVNRIVNASKEKPIPPAPAGSPEPDKTGGNPNPNEEPAWFKSYRETQDQRMNQIEQVNISKTRIAAYTEKIKDLPEKHQSALLKDFSRVVGTFKDDTDFASYLTEKEADISALNQELADLGLKKMKRPGGGGEPAGEEEAFVKTMKEINAPEKK